MPKRFFIVIFICILILTFFKNESLFSQCIPDPLINSPGVYPGEIPHALAGQPYLVVLTIVVPVDTVVDVPFVGPLTIPVDSVGIDSIRGLPAGYLYYTNSPSDFWKGGQKGCFKVEGQSDRPGIYNLVFYLRGHTPITLPPYTTSDGFVSYQYEYEMHIDDISSFQVMQNVPNPCYNGITNITYITSSDHVDFTLYDCTGRVVVRKHIPGNAGQNVLELNIPLEAGMIANGLYFYSMDDGFETVTMKMIVNMMP